MKKPKKVLKIKKKSTKYSLFSKLSAKKGKKGTPGVSDILLQLLLTTVIFMVLFGGYTAIQKKSNEQDGRQIALSQLVADIKVGSVKSISV